MADCGPSNPLQSFRKHTSVDRTLQQDRLISRQSPASGFRSSPGPSAGLLDPEFEAFQAGFNPGFIQPELHHSPQQHFSPSSASAFAQPPPVLGWASDFQRLQISQQPQPAPVFREFVPQQQQQQHNSAAWHQEFQGHRGASMNQQSNQPLFQPQPGDVGASMSYNSANGRVMAQYAGNGQFFGWSDSVQQPLSSHNTQSSQRVDGNGNGKQVMPESYSAADFEREFQQHDPSIRQQYIDQEARTSLELGQDVLMDDNSSVENIRAQIAQLQEESQALNAQEMERQHLHEQEVQEAAYHGLERSPPTDDELAVTAGELLERVADNTTDKFQQSNFFALMRRLRDGEARVEGDKIVGAEDADQNDSSIPASEQDYDVGRDAKMAGALQPHVKNESLPPPSRQERDQSYHYHHMIDDF